MRKNLTKTAAILVMSAMVAASDRLRQQSRGDNCSSRGDCRGRRD